MSSGFHRMGANAGKAPGYSNKAGTGPLSHVRAPLFNPDAFMAGEPIAPATALKADPTLLESERLQAPVMGRAQAVQSGYTGDQCSHCSSMRMKISGHCMVCEDCGTTTGCS